jgi:hypothetical protein
MTLTLSNNAYKHIQKGRKGKLFQLKEHLKIRLLYFTLQFFKNKQVKHVKYVVERKSIIIIEDFLVLMSASGKREKEKSGVV